MRNLTLFTLLVLFMVGCGSVSDETPAATLEIQAQERVYPDQEWKDTDGNRINAHSGGVLYDDGFYYWYGTHKIPGTDERTGRTDLGVHVYRSRDLLNWDDLGLALNTADNPAPDLTGRPKIQRVKVVYNASTDKYVMFFKLYLQGDGIRKSHVGVATADTPAGPFTYQNKFLATTPSGSGDHYFYQFANGDLYHIAVLRDGTRELALAKMRGDYRFPATEYRRMEGIQRSTEGIAIIERDGVFHLFGSASAGWKPTAPRYYTSTSLRGPWTKQANPLRGYNPISNVGTDLTFGAQSSFINELAGADNRYILMMDVHMPRNPYDSRYIWLPFKVEDGKMVVRWQDSWNLGWFGGDGGGGGNGEYAIRVRARGKSGSERIRVRLNGQNLATFDLQQGYNTFTTSTSERGNLYVDFVNDNGEERDAYIDWLSVNGNRRQAEAQGGNTAAWGNGTCGGGSFTQNMECNGSINFGGVAKDER